MNIIGIQHLLPSTRWLVGAINENPLWNQIVIFGKDYSTCAEIEDDFRTAGVLGLSLEAIFQEKHANDLSLLDEGGRLHAALPSGWASRTSSVEQTTFGMQATWKCPTVLVCRSASKLEFESQIIARGISRKLASLGILADHTVGVIGLGALGAAVMRELLRRGAPTLGADKVAAPSDLQDWIVGQGELLRRADVVLGATGVNCLRIPDLSVVRGPKIFASCSSSDVEFSSLATHLPRRGRFDSIQGRIGEVDCTILNGGYPINFDRTQEWELFEEIILTRRLMLDGLAQATGLVGSPARGVMLDPVAQLNIVNEWLDQVPDRHELIVPSGLTARYFRDHSEGEHVLTEKPQYRLHSTTPGALAKMRSHQAPYETAVLGLPILVLPDVWSPAYDWSSLFYAENMSSTEGLDFLEIGCGTGVISVFAARGGARRVVAIDVNPKAVENARLNFERFKLDDASSFVSDGFTNVRGEFDVICWNAPYHGSKPADLLERGCADENYGDIRAFFRDAGKHLKTGGMVVFGFSESGDLALIEHLIVNSGLRIKRRLSDWRQDYNCLLFELVRTKIDRSGR